MDARDITNALRDFIKHRFNVPENDPDFDDNVHLFDYGYVDSFGAVDLSAFVEKYCSISITQSDLIAFPLNSIREIADFAARRKNGEL